MTVVNPALQEISRSPVTATVLSQDVGYKHITVELPHNINAEAEFDPEYPDTPGALFLSTYNVPPEFRHHGFATRLYSALTYVAITNSFTLLHGNVESPHMIKIYKKLFDDRDITFIDGDPENEHNDPLPITCDEAIDSLLREWWILSSGDKALSHSLKGFDFNIELGNVALGSLEAPIIVNKGLAAEKEN